MAARGPHTYGSMSNLSQYAKAAQHLPMAWLTQAEFPAKPLVVSSFEDALEELPRAGSYQESLVRSSLETIVAGPDPRGGSFEAQAIHAAAKLHDRVSVLALEPRVKAPKVRKGSILHGYAGGVFGETYGHRLVTRKGDGWINVEYLDGEHQGVIRRYHGNLKELAEYLVPDHHCGDNCTLGQDR
jgi:hypothetical protein